MIVESHRGVLRGGPPRPSLASTPSPESLSGSTTFVMMEQSGVGLAVKRERRNPPGAACPGPGPGPRAAHVPPSCYFRKKESKEATNTKFNHSRAVSPRPCYTFHVPPDAFQCIAIIVLVSSDGSPHALLADTNPQDLIQTAQDSVVQNDNDVRRVGDEVPLQSDSQLGCAPSVAEVAPHPPWFTSLQVRAWNTCLRPNTA